MLTPCASRKRARCARRAAGSEPSTARAMRGTSGPETRSTPTAPRPGALAIAAMVSGVCTPGVFTPLVYGTRRRERAAPSRAGLRRSLNHLVDAPLLQYGEHRVGEPVKHQTGWKPRHHAGHH